jgi:hypothetical protein
MVAIEERARSSRRPADSFLDPQPLTAAFFINSSLLISMFLSS